jgi:methionyl-tRNA formyltransferase
MESPSIIILTGNDDRHKFFIHHLNANFSISEVYIEEGKYPSPISMSKDESNAWDWFFRRREYYEKRLLSESSLCTAKNKPTTTYLNNNELNSEQTLINIKKANPGFIAVFGTSILKTPILKEFQNRLFNLHIGDPEFYRGSSCNFWPVYQGKLNYLSATIHRIDENIDTGDILERQAVSLSKDDNDQKLLLKPLQLGAKLMVNTIKNWQSGTLQSIPQNKTGKLYKKSDFNSKVLLNFKQMVESGKLDNNIQASLDKTLAGVNE